MIRESLPLLIALVLPLAAAAALLPAGDKDTAQPMQPERRAPVAQAAPPSLLVPATAPLAGPLPVAGVWLNF